CRNLILKLMAKDPNQRLQSADALIATINTILNDKGAQVKAGDSVRLAAPSRRKAFDDPEENRATILEPRVEGDRAAGEATAGSEDGDGGEEALPGLE
ncbi:MAG: hypothetical protein KIS92_08285, partial [Planctomycetota bacterium]|nr:hypothetical protein [Planctomycetota bacterium]